MWHLFVSVDVTSISTWCLITPVSRLNNFFNHWGKRIIYIKILFFLLRKYISCLNFANINFVQNFWLNFLALLVSIQCASIDLHNLTCKSDKNLRNKIVQFYHILFFSSNNTITRTRMVLWCGRDHVFSSLN